MNSFEKKRKEARKKWDSLAASKVPVIYLGSATCGRAAGAMEVLDTIRDTLKKKRLKKM